MIFVMRSAGKKDCCSVLSNSLWRAVRRICRFLFLIVCAACHTQIAEVQPETLATERFGILRLYKPKGEVRDVLLLFSSEEGWSQDIGQFASRLMGTDTLIIGVDTKSYVAQMNAEEEECSYLAGEIERLSQSVQQSIGLAHYQKPMLVGYASGATITFAILAQSAKPFRGGVFLAPQSSLEMNKPLCEGDALLCSFKESEVKSSTTEKAATSRTLTLALKPGQEIPGVFLCGEFDTACRNTFHELVPEGSGKQRVLNRLGHELQPIEPWVDAVEPLIKGSRALGMAVTNITLKGVDDLPLIELLPEQVKSDFFVIFYSGDGGWAGIDKEVGAYLKERGVPVIGFDSLNYFWKKKSPEESARDLDRVIELYGAKLGLKKVALAGFSMGADVTTILSPRVREMRSASTVVQNISSLVLLSPGISADLEVHIGDWIGIGSAPTGIPLRPALENLRTLPIFCVCGEDEEQCACRDMKQEGLEFQEVGSDHHFDGRYEEVSEQILKFWGIPEAPASRSPIREEGEEPSR